MPKLSSAADLEKFRKDILVKRDPNKICVTVCSGTGCQAYGCKGVAEAFFNEIKNKNLQTKVDVRRTGCHGFCERGTVVIILPDETCYLHVKPDDAPDIVQKTLIEKKIVDRLLYEGPDGKKVARENEIPFYKHQNRVIFGNNKFIDPNSIDDYIAPVAMLLYLKLFSR